MRGGDAGGPAAGNASRVAGTSVAIVTTSLAAVELCDEDVAMRCSAQSDAGSAADPEWEAVLAQQLAEEEEDKEFYRCDEEEEDARIEGARFCGCSQPADGWDGCSEEEEDGHAAVQGVAGTQKVDESLELRDERACATGGGFGMPQAALTSVGYHSCTGIEEGINNHNKGIEGGCASPVPIVTNRPPPSS